VHPAGVSANPAGSVPAVIAQVYGPVPPAATIGAVYGTPTVAPGNVVVVSVRGVVTAEIVIVSCAVAV